MKAGDLFLRLSNQIISNNFTLNWNFNVSFRCVSILREKMIALEVDSSLIVKRSRQLLVNRIRMIHFQSWRRSTMASTVSKAELDPLRRTKSWRLFCRSFSTLNRLKNFVATKLRSWMAPKEPTKSSRYGWEMWFVRIKCTNNNIGLTDWRENYTFYFL